MQLFNCIAHRNDTSHINDLTDEQIPSFKIAYDDMLKLAGVLADTKATNAASNAEKERLQNIRQLADSVIEKINKRKAELQSPCTPEEICNRYKEMFGEELAPEDAVRLFVKEYGNDSLIKANGQRILYIYDMDEAMNAVHCKILGADAAENQKKRNEYLCQLRMYNGGIMPQDTLHSLMDCYTFVLSRDYVMSAQFERLLNGCISSNCQRYNLQLQISSSVLNEVKEKSLFDADSEARARCKMIDKQLERLKKDNRLHVVQINAKNTYSEADEFAELDSNRSMFYCLLTLRPDGFPDADSGKAPNVLFGKFLISGDFMLYRRSLERLHLSERTAGSDFKTTFCDENGNTVTLEHKSSSGGEGTIYTTDLEGKVAKLFNQQAAKKKEKKLKTGSLIDLCILTYNGNGVQEYGKPGFTPISDVEERFDFTPFGSSPLFTAANTALNLLLRQIELYRENQVVSDKGWLIIFSDGQADDGIGGEISFEGLRSRFSNSEIKKRINVLCGCFGYQYDNLEAVTARSAIKNMLEENNFVGYIQSLSHSIQVQSRPVEDGYN